jgi:hypothetical protein
MKKTCMLCKYWYFDGGSPGYSEYTPGIDWSMLCNEGVWDCDDKYITVGGFRSIMKKAESCSKFEEAPEGE